MATTLRGTSLLRDPRLNKSTAFSEAEREGLGLVGLVPEGIDNEDTQVQRVLLQLGHKPTDIEKYIFLSQLQDMDETLFYRLLMSNPAQFLPLVYTPTVRRGLSAVWPHYPPSQGSIHFNQAERAHTGNSPQLA
jgi:malate dehydrogenase (oxaloacetate-decarboxylating)(NADP+)